MAFGSRLIPRRQIGAGGQVFGNGGLQLSPAGSIGSYAPTFGYLPDPTPIDETLGAGIPFPFPDVPFMDEPYAPPPETAPAPGDPQGDLQNARKAVKGTKAGVRSYTKTIRRLRRSSPGAKDEIERIKVERARARAVLKEEQRRKKEAQRLFRQAERERKAAERATRARRPAPRKPPGRGKYV